MRRLGVPVKRSGVDHPMKSILGTSDLRGGSCSSWVVALEDQLISCCGPTSRAAGLQLLREAFPLEKIASLHSLGVPSEPKRAQIGKRSFVAFLLKAGGNSLLEESVVEPGRPPGEKAASLSLVAAQEREAWIGDGAKVMAGYVCRELMEMLFGGCGVHLCNSTKIDYAICTQRLARELFAVVDSHQLVSDSNPGCSSCNQVKNVQERWVSFVQYLQVFMEMPFRGDAVCICATLQNSSERYAICAQRLAREHLLLLSSLIRFCLFFLGATRASGPC